MSKSYTRKNFMLNLCRRGIPARYAWRVSRELNDHEEDLSENGSNATLGDQDELLDQIVDSYKSRTFAGRHPLFVFLLFPFPIVILSYILSFLLPFILVSIFFVINNSLNIQLSEVNFFVPLLDISIFTGLTFIPPIITLLVIYRWARKSGLKTIRAILSCLPVFLMAFTFQTFFSEANNMRIAFKLNLPLGRWLGPQFGPIDQPWPLLGFNQIMQVTISALIIFYLVHHEKVKQNRLAEKLNVSE